MTQTLAGSVKQVEWAESIRSSAIANLESAMSHERSTDVAVDLAAIRERMDGETEARWWIDNRGWFSRFSPHTYGSLSVAHVRETINALLAPAPVKSLGQMSNSEIRAKLDAMGRR